MGPMSGAERRRAERHPVNIAGQLFLSDGRGVEVQILNLGTMGALVQIGDLEEAVFEGERAVLDHPSLTEANAPTEDRRRTPGRVVRVELEFLEEGVTRQLAMHFDGGEPPSGYDPSP